MDNWGNASELMFTINDWLWDSSSEMGSIAAKILDGWKRISQLPDPTADPDWEELDSVVRGDLDKLCRFSGRKAARDRIIEWYRARGIDIAAAQH
jgi:hypothetical protein